HATPDSRALAVHREVGGCPGWRNQASPGCSRAECQMMAKRTLPGRTGSRQSAAARVLGGTQRIPSTAEILKGLTVYLLTIPAEALAWVWGVSRHEFVANAPPRTQVSRFGGVLFYLLAQPRHMDRYGTRVAEILVMPDLVQQVLTGEDLTWMRRKE